MKECANCHKQVRMWWNSYTKRQEPESNYWKGQNITEVYCSAKCSLEKWEKDNGKKHDVQTAAGIQSSIPCMAR